MTVKRYSFGEHELEPATYTLSARRQAVQLEPRVLELLVYLVEHRDRMVTKEELFEKLWPRKYVSESVLTRAIYEARRAVDDDSRRQAVIKTVHSRGYQFVAAVSEITVADEEVPSPAPQPEEAPAEPAPAQETAVAPLPARKRRWLLPAVLAGAVLLLGVGLVRFWPVQPAPQERLAVLPFDVDTEAKDLEWGELALPSLLAETLTERSELVVFPANRVNQSLQQKGLRPDAREQEKIAALRDLFGVDHVLFGSVRREGGGVRVDFELVGSDGRRRSGSVLGAGPGSLTGELAKNVARELNVAYAAGIPVRKIAADEFINEAFARGLDSLLRGELADALRYFETCLVSDRDNGWARYEMGNALSLLGHWDDAQTAFVQASARSEATGDANLGGAAASGLGVLAWRRGQLAQAEQYFQTAQQRFAAVDRRANLASAHGNLGILAENRGQFASARQHYETALALYRSEGERAGESAVYSNLAVLERKSGRLDAAAQLQQRAIDLQRATGLHEMLIFSLSHLGELERDRGHWQAAREVLDEALNIARRTGSRIGEADSLAGRAALVLDLGRRAEAESDFRAARAIYTELESPAGEARTSLQLAKLLKTSNTEEARNFATTSLRAAERLGDETLKLESELALVDLGATDLARVLPRVQTAGDHRLLALSWALRARLEQQPAHLRTALDHAARAGGQRLQAELAVELGRMLLAQGEAPSTIEPLLGKAEAWMPDFPAALLLRACYLAGLRRPVEAERILDRATALLGSEGLGDLSWCPSRL